MQAELERGVTYLRGYVTTFAAVSGKTSSELEQLLGFGKGYLSDGFLVYELVAPSDLHDFHWADRTAYSGGWHYDPVIGEYVQRDAEMRAHFGKVTNNNEAATDALIRRVLEGKLAVLKSERIVKICPKVRKRTTYPDSTARHVPQWTLKSDKLFRLIADVDPGGACP
jgi:hypothetical protein